MAVLSYYITAKCVPTIIMDIIIYSHVNITIYHLSFTTITYMYI